MITRWTNGLLLRKAKSASSSSSHSNGKAGSWLSVNLTFGRARSLCALRSSQTSQFPLFQFTLHLPTSKPGVCVKWQVRPITFRLVMHLWRKGGKPRRVDLCIALMKSWPVFISLMKLWPRSLAQCKPHSGDIERFPIHTLHRCYLPTLLAEEFIWKGFWLDGGFVSLPASLQTNGYALTA